MNYGGNKTKAPEASCTVDSLTRILSRSQHLKHFGMPFAFWRISDGIKVLDTVLSVSKGSLQSLFVEGFFQSDAIHPQSDEFDRVNNGILSLNRLTELGIDYVFLSDAFVNAMARSYARLKKLKLFDNHYLMYRVEIQQSSWVKLTQACPEIKVALYTNSDSDWIITMLDPVLPIYDLRMNMSVLRYFRRGSVARLLEHIKTNFSHSLVELHMVAGKKEKIDGVFLRLVRQCTHLVHVNVSARFTNPKIKKTVLDIIQKRRRQLHLEKFPETSHKRMRKNTTDGAV
ncbi:uncharacterized protein LOC131939020 [Physella acuta]|uniref:uncharacterized protein LOC131939020 n=1 Tax=Physella acuta TaxID=109671 RepID=UPI0027DD524A|nr:uncharacterized protein LOC131939020 [Physella acuta]